MGREVKRVPVGFDWPLKTVWHGYLSWFRPPNCGACDGDGYNPEARAFKDSLPGYSDERHKVIAERFPNKTYRCKWCSGKGSVYPTDPAVLAALAPWKEDEYDYYDFPRQEPPAGAGWQLWETVSEGSPLTPAFATAEELARWCAAHQFDGKQAMPGERWNFLAGGNRELSYEQWLAFLTGTGWAPSMVVSNRGIQSGVEFSIEQKAE